MYVENSVTTIKHLRRQSTHSGGDSSPSAKRYQQFRYMYTHNQLRWDIVYNFDQEVIRQCIYMY